MYEILLRPARVRRHPLLMGILGALSVCIAVILSWKIFPESSSVLLVTFTIIPIIPIMVKLIEYEEDRLEHRNSIFRNMTVIKIYCSYFVGVTAAFLIWGLVLTAPLEESLFSGQIDAIYDFRGPSGFATVAHVLSYDTVDDLYAMECPTEVVARFGGGCEPVDFNKDGIAEMRIIQDGKPTFLVSPSGKAMPYNSFLLRHIILNNLQILFFTLLTSFIFGAGALFVITWNASIIGIFFAELIRAKASLPYIAGFFVHGVPEILGFFVAAIAGGVLSVVFVRHHWSSPEARIVMKDFVMLTVAAIILIFVAGVLEVYL